MYRLYRVFYEYMRKLACSKSTQVHAVVHFFGEAHLLVLSWTCIVGCFCVTWQTHPIMHLGKFGGTYEWPLSEISNCATRSAKYIASHTSQLSLAAMNALASIDTLCQALSFACCFAAYAKPRIAYYHSLLSPTIHLWYGAYR